MNDYPTHELLPIPDGLDEGTLRFVLTYLMHVAIGFELLSLAPREQVVDVGSIPIDDFIEQLERGLRDGQRSADEVDGALELLGELTDFLVRAIEQTAHS